MILSSAGIANGTILETILCVVGAGPAGIVLGITAAEAGLPVLILESGGLRPDDASQALCAGEVEQGVRHPPAMTYRRRGLGGSSTLWGGRCVPLDPIDFEERDWLDLPSTWPIRYETLLPYWVRAHGWAELGRFEYAAAAA
ncbi:MAG TPA: GMC family oxidoreductase, partial [Acetobacteraceae bacterium]|nr:GMC family oxidoreductase [Acetobacteraceae bacterium]